MATYESGWKNRIFRVRSRLMRLAVRLAMQPVVEPQPDVGDVDAGRQDRHADRVDAGHRRVDDRQHDVES